MAEWGVVYKAEDAAEALQCFQQALNFKSSSPTDPVISLAQLELARTYALIGDTRKSHVAYEDFLALWTGADSNLLPLKQAKAEYAKLR